MTFTRACYVLLGAALIVAQLAFMEHLPQTIMDPTGQVLAVLELGAIACAVVGYWRDR